MCHSSKFCPPCDLWNIIRFSLWVKKKIFQSAENKWLPLSVYNNLILRIKLNNLHVPWCLLAIFACLLGKNCQLSSIIWNLVCQPAANSSYEILYLYDLQVALSVLLGIILAGAALGYWIVRKFVISKEDGSVDAGVAQFVKWAMRVIGTTFVLQVCIFVNTKWNAMQCSWYN